MYFHATIPVLATLIALLMSGIYFRQDSDKLGFWSCFGLGSVGTGFWIYMDYKFILFFWISSKIMSQDYMQGFYVGLILTFWALTVTTALFTCLILHKEIKTRIKNLCEKTELTIHRAQKKVSR